MLKFIDLLNDRKNRAEESGAAMIFAIILLMVMVMVTVLVAATATTAASTAKTISLREGMLSTANAGIEHALFNANNSSSSVWLENTRGVDQAIIGTPPDGSANIGNLKWRIYTERVVTAGNKVSYYIYSTGYDNTLGLEKGITLRARFDGTPIVSGTYETPTKISYSIAADAAYANGILGLNGVELTAGTKIYTSDSSYSVNPIGTESRGTEASTNFAVTVGDSSIGLRGVTSSYTGVNTGCSGSGCDSLTVSYRESTVSLNEATKALESTCPAASYAIWKASENGGILNIPSGSCVGGLVFDTDTTVPANFSANTPLRINVKGNVTIDSGVEVNKTNRPVALMIRSTGGNFTTAGTAEANLLYTSEAATCTLNGNTKFFGGLACNTVKVYGASVVHLDSAARSIQPISNRHLWNFSYVEEL